MLFRYLVLYTLEKCFISLLFTSLYHTHINASEISQNNITMSFCREACIAFLLICFVFVAAIDHHSNINWAFKNQRSIRNDLYPCHRSIGITFSSDPIQSVSISYLNVSTTLYVSMELVEVTWPPVSNSCRDDFIGIYFVETSILTGIYFTYV